MNFDTYRPLALRTAKMFPTKRENVRHAALGLLTEIGEFATGVKRHVIYGKSLDAEIVVDGKTTTIRKNMIEEIGDAQWYLPLLMLALDIEALPFDMLQPYDGNEDLGDLTIYLGSCGCGVAAFLAGGSLNDPGDIHDVARMIGGLLYLIDDYIAPMLGTTGDQIRAQNIHKLQQRYPEKYSDAAAEARADKNGVDARNS